MIRATIVSCIGMRELCLDIYEQYKSCIPKQFSSYKYDGRGSFVLPLMPDSKELTEVIEIFKSAGVSPTLFSRVHYTKKEIDNAEFFQLIEPFPLELEGTSAADYGTQYDGCCSRCGFGGTRIGDIFIDRKFTKKAKIGNLFPELYVAEDIRTLIDANNLTGITFGKPIQDYRGRDMSLYYSAQIENVLPPLSETTCLEPSGLLCPSCNHETVYLRSDLQYKKEALQSAKDFNLTREHLDNWNLRSIVVSARVRNLLKEYKMKVGRFIPVAIL